MQKLLLIDGNAILHRAYHALPKLTNSKGEIVNAVYGFFSMLLNVLNNQKPDYLAVCFDRPGPNFRQALFVGYQQHRPAMADDFVPQIILVHSLLEKMKAAVFELDGYEADDLIGTIANLAVKGRGLSFSDDARGSLINIGSNTRSLSENRLRKKNISSKLHASVFNSSEKDEAAPIDVVILTGDRDMLQLVNPKVKILMPITGITKTILFDEGAVEEKYGVKPSQFIDYKALIGDASDGYPGVSGIGPKTASGLLQKYDTFENLYTRLGELPEKIGERLATDAEQAALAKKLATIVTDAPIQFVLENCEVGRFDIASLRQGFEEQGFKSLSGRMESVFGSAKQNTELNKKENKKKANGQLKLLN